ncbi:hypothetical protein WJX73_008071 [Symbiochloris irregularis]|uniref:Histone deacetylase complex subunit SAP18 n=1 Tax=Symbiochloris irregularis TaxID=706552 RepID=A0AAW1NT83_9CHLO
MDPDNHSAKAFRDAAIPLWGFEKLPSSAAAIPAATLAAPAPVAPLPKLDRTKVCPFLLRVFVKLGGHHRLEEYQSRGHEPADSLCVYTWPDADLHELMGCVKDGYPQARRANARLEFAFVYPDRRGRNVMRQVGGTHSTRSSPDDKKTLRELNFQTGDYLDVALY